MNASICTPGKPDQRLRRASEDGCNFAIENDLTLLLAGNHLPWSIGSEMKEHNPISRCKE